MKNPHVNMDQCNPTEGNKKFKRKVRGLFKRTSDDKDMFDSKKIVDSMGLLVDEVYGNNCEKRLQGLDPTTSNGEHTRKPDILNTALDMKMYSLPSVTGNKTETQPRTISETAVTHKNDTSPQAIVFDNQQAFPTDYLPQSRIVLCKRSERSLSSTSRASYINNSADPTDSPRKRLGEPSGVVTEIKAIQQTRRLLANARERTRVHTISAAFEALRKQVPCYSYGQKLSKLAILRIACNYILSLAQLADLDYTPDHSNMSFRDCVEQCTRTLQAEGRSKKRKE
ncbi:protein atonal homolog 8 [Electrophorus electricus]|uniref:Protein atonal homolog 8 n=1 Tax=Electrophorus electricus TaxID=8005 RepID=A0A4W4FF84_ELEEL|nr:protein atonal homolog 8 [Electrophorus electricus]